MRALTNDVGLCVLADKGVRRVREASDQEVSRNWTRASLYLYTTLCSFVSIDLDPVALPKVMLPGADSMFAA